MVAQSMSRRAVASLRRMWVVPIMALCWRHCSRVDADVAGLVGVEFPPGIIEQPATRQAVAARREDIEIRRYMVGLLFVVNST